MRPKVESFSHRFEETAEAVVFEGEVKYLTAGIRHKRKIVLKKGKSNQKGLNKIYGGNTKKVVQDYYKIIREMLRYENPDILGHLDLIKINNNEEKYFSEKEPWYRHEVMDTLKAVAKSSSILEVNTGGIARGKIDSLYPSTWILEEAYQMRIPITLSSDAHKPEQITAKFKEAAVLLNSIGYKEIYVPHRKTWAPHPISVEGVEL